MAKVIHVEHLSKAYQLGDFGTGTISRDLERFWARIRGKEDPFLKIGQVNDRTKKGESDIVWSLNDLSFEVENGDAVGVIGRNGAGKSTLLKILSRVTSPTVGTIRVKGRIASLLEVGTGFHPELTGRENIFLNGAILGMRKAEIKRKFDEIVEFAGVERYIDTPVKRYSTGMHVRLAFAVAAHLESEILIVDEVLAVGDAEFQKKCLGKMGDVSKADGRTILFVSHNMGSISELCQKGILLENGRIKTIGGINDCVSSYLATNFEHTYSNTKTSGMVYISKVAFIDAMSKEKKSFAHSDEVYIKFDFANFDQCPPNVYLTLVVKDELNAPVFATHKILSKIDSEYFEITMVLPRYTLLPGDYVIDVMLHIPFAALFDRIDNRLKFRIDDTGNIHSGYPGQNFGRVNINVDWIV
jgi:lipopolysaccharide transport system ATP-binding protein